MKCPLLLAAASISLTPSVAMAEDGIVDQVEGLEIEQGELEIEGQLIHARQDRSAGNSWFAGTTLEYGLSDRLQVGLEWEAEREGGGSLELEAVGPQLKWVAIDPANAAIGLGIQFALPLAIDSGAVGTELVLIAQTVMGGIDAIGNLIIETEPGELSDVSTGYALRLDHAVSDRLGIGVEAGGGVSGEGEGSHFFGPVLVSEFVENGPELELGIFAPLSDRAPDVQIRVELDWSF